MILAYRSEFVTEPLADALRRRGWQTVPLDETGTADEGGSALLISGRANVVLSSPLDYARAVGLIDYALVPGIAVTTQGFAGLIRLIFNTGLQSLTTMAVKPGSAYEELVTRIILSEKHDIEPTSLPVATTATLEEMLAAADSALVSGDDAIFNTAGRTALFDITDEWGDAVETPLPYRLLWGIADSIPAGAMEDLRAARDESLLTLADRAASHPRAAEATAFYERYLKGEVSFELGQGELTALDAFFRYAFYYGTITDIPGLQVMGAEQS